MFFPLRLKTKLVIAITGMVLVIVALLSSLYITQLVRQLVDDAYKNADVHSLLVYQVARDALENDLADPRLKLNDEKALQDAIEESLQTDAALNSLLQSIVGYAPTIYDVAITDNSGKVMVHTDANMMDRKAPARENFAVIRNSRSLAQLAAIYGKKAHATDLANLRALLSSEHDQEVYEIQLPMKRDNQPFATIRIGISTVFLKNSLQPRLEKALLLSGGSLLGALLLAAVLSNLALRPLERISRRLDEMTAATALAAPAATGTGERRKSERKDEYGVVSGKIDRLGQQMRDVKEVFSALKENLDQIMANLQDGLMLFTREERAVLVSSSVEQFLRTPRAELLGKDIGEIFAGHGTLGALVLESFATHQPLQQTEISLDGSGARRVQVSLDFIEENGERIGALLTLRDAESVHRIEDELELSRRLAAVGRLTSGVAHEVKNPINAIVVHLEVLRQKLRELDPDTRRHMDVIAMEIRRLDRVVQTLVDFTRPMELRLSEIDLRRLLDDVLTLSTPDAEKHGVHIVRDLPETPLPVKVDSDLVKQAILNVMINGMQAMAANGGTMRISAHANVNNEAQIEIADEGSGIPEKIREKIFNLYFTTKSGGSGIGLPMTYRVVQLHNGSMDFESVEGKGTTFRLRFPLSEGRELAEPAAQANAGTLEAH
jgi:signal transduction histidine kinase